MLRPGRNIAIKVPLYRYEETVAFYRDRVGLPVTRTMANSTGFGFGELTLWIERVQSKVERMFLKPRSERRLALRPTSYVD